MVINHVESNINATYSGVALSSLVSILFALKVRGVASELNEAILWWLTFLITSGLIIPITVKQIKDGLGKSIVYAFAPALIFTLANIFFYVAPIFLEIPGMIKSIPTYNINQDSQQRERTTRTNRVEYVGEKKDDGKSILRPESLFDRISKGFKHILFILFVGFLTHLGISIAIWARAAIFKIFSAFWKINSSDLENFSQNLDISSKIFVVLGAIVAVFL